MISGRFAVILLLSAVYSTPANSRQVDSLEVGNMTARQAVSPTVQSGDSSAVRTDTFSGTADTASGRIDWSTRSFETSRSGDLLYRTPVKYSEMDLPDLLGSIAGLFEHRFGPAGWPSGISYRGIDPNLTGLQFDGLPFDDLITGRPRFDLLPLGVLNDVRLDVPGPGTAAGIAVHSSPFVTEKPLTNLLYRSSNTGLQAVDVVHAQTRRIPFLDTNQKMNLVVGYAGAGARGEYPGSRLRRARRLFSRLRINGEDWNLQVMELFNRRRVGAQEGVLRIPGQGRSSIFERIGARVRNPETTRTTVRNDLSARFSASLLEEPYTITAFWSNQTLQYTTPSDTLGARIHRIGLIGHQSFSKLGHSILASATLWRERLRSGSIQTIEPHPARSWAEISVRDSVVLGPARTTVSLGLHDDGGRVFTSSSVIFTASRHSIRGRLIASSTGLRRSWQDLNGFDLVGDSRAIPDSLRTRFKPGLSRVELSVAYHRVPFAIKATGYFQELRNTVGRFISDADARFTGTTILPKTLRNGISLQIDYGDPSAYGLYASIRPTIQTSKQRNPSTDGGALDRSVPQFWMHVRVGIRRMLFKGDLDLNVSLRGSYWSDMDGMRLDAATGQLALAANRERNVPSSGTLDFIAEAGIHSATVFVSFENLLSGTAALDGNLLIPEYPLPAQRFRFGVFWPIVN